MNSEPLLLQGRYRRLRNLGSGAMGTVWLAEDELLERVVAVKELVQHASAEDMAERRVRAVHEAWALARIDHPAIVPIHDVVHDGGDPWLVMKYIRGRSLDKILREGALGERAIAAIGLPIVQALSATHRAGVIHRDIKPTNIMVADDRSIFLIDFGIARIDGTTRITNRYKLIGTPEFLAPERVQDKPVGSATDLWSFGVTLFLALERYSPFRRSSDHATMYAIANDDTPQLRHGGRLAQVIMELLHKDPDLRPRAEDVAGILESIIGGPEPPDLRSARPPSQPTPWTGQARPGDQQSTVSARDDLNEVGDLIRGVGTDAGAAMLIRMPRGDAARILLDYDSKVAGELLQGIAISRPEVAADIMRILQATDAGSMLVHLRPSTAAAVLQVMPTSEAAEIIGYAGEMTAAAIMMHVRATVAVQLIAELPAGLAEPICRRMRPAAVAAMQKIEPDLINRLLEKASPEFRAEVRRYGRRLG